MPPLLLIDLDQADLDRDCMTRAQLYELLPHRHEFMLLDGACLLDTEGRRIVAYTHVHEDAWWCRGHVPGRPLLPGVLMLEIAAQASAILAKCCGGYDGFIGFGGVDDCKFREAVVPPARLIVLATATQHRSRRIVSATQGLVDGRLVFEATITGLTMPG